MWMTGVQVRERVLGDCYSCDAEIEITDEMPGEIVDCPDCGLELELALYNPTMKERYGSRFWYEFNGERCQYTLAQAPEEKEDWGE